MSYKDGLVGNPFCHAQAGKPGSSSRKQLLADRCHLSPSLQYKYLMDAIAVAPPACQPGETRHNTGEEEAQKTQPIPGCMGQRQGKLFPFHPNGKEIFFFSVGFIFLSFKALLWYGLDLAPLSLAG